MHWISVCRLTKGRVPDLDDLLRQIEMDELSETAHQQEGEQRTDFSSADEEEVEQLSEEEMGLEDSILDELLNEGGEDDDEENDEDEA